MHVRRSRNAVCALAALVVPAAAASSCGLAVGPGITPDHVTPALDATRDNDAPETGALAPRDALAPPPLVASQVATNGLETCIVQPDERVSCWGDNRLGQLGDGQAHACGNSDIGNCSPTPLVVPGVTTAVEIASGAAHVCVRRADGIAECWGDNGRGQLMPGTSTLNHGHVVLDDLGRIAQIAAGDAFTCALRDDGTVACWGGGIVSAPSGTYPSVDVHDVVQIACGSQHACALRRDGTVACWGGGFFGQLGNGTTNSSGPAVLATGLLDATQVTASANHSCALRAGGTVVCWGSNQGEQLGVPSIPQSAVPVPVAGLTDVRSVSAGGMHVCALRRDGAVLCWGARTNGRLGDGQFAGSRYTPDFVLGLATDVVEVSAGFRHVCARRAGGELWCWGNNAAGQLGDGAFFDRALPGMVGL